MNTKEILYRGKDLSFAYRLGGVQQQVLDKISFEIPRGSMIGLAGPSGSGKSTLLNLLGLIESPQEGNLEFRGEPINLLPEARLNHLRRHDIGFIFQDFQIIEVLSVEENIAYFLHRQKIAPSIRQSLVEESLNAVGLWQHRHKRPSELSGGQRQRVAIARAVAKRPAVIIADEPTASLDTKNGHQIMQILKLLNERQQVSVILASHDPVVLSYVGSTIQLADGKIVNHEGDISYAS